MTADASPRWAPAIGAAAGACLIVFNVVLLAVDNADLTLPATILGLLLLVPLIGRWPLRRGRVLGTAFTWFLVGGVLALVGGGYVALASIPPMIGCLVGWGTRDGAPAR